MSTGTLLLFVLIAIALSIAVSAKFKMNLGVIGMLFAFIIGVFFLKMKVNSIIVLWPTKVVFQLMVITMFFSYAVKNGTLQMVAMNLLYKFRNVTWFIPFAMFLITVVLGALGGPPPVANAIMAVLCFAIAAQAGYHLLLIAIIACLGAIVGSCAPFGVCGSLIRGVLVSTKYADISSSLTIKCFIGLFITAFIVLIVGYFVFGAHKVKKVSLDKPEPATPVQKKNLIIIVIIVCLAVLPNLFNKIIPSPAMKTISGFLDIQVCCLIGVVLSFFLKLGDEKEILVKGIPWGTIVMVGGISMLMAIGTEAGAVQFLSSWVVSNVPAIMVGPILTILGGFLSFFSGGITTVFPMVSPMVEPIVGVLGLQPSALYTSVLVGGAITSISPFSTGGSLILANARNEKESKTLFYGQLVIAFFGMIVGAVLSIAGVFALIS